MTQHVAGDLVVPCLAASHGRCRVCELTDPGGPHYREDYRRLFHPGEFADEVPTAAVPPAVPTAAPPTVAPAIPLAGDLVEALARRIGADRLARWVEAKLGVPCGCPERKETLNRLDRMARRFLGW